MGLFSFFGSLFPGPKRKFAPTPKDRVLNQEYRNPGDSKDINRLDKAAPKGLPKKVNSNVEFRAISCKAS